VKPSASAESVAAAPAAPAIAATHAEAVGARVAPRATAPVIGMAAVAGATHTATAQRVTAATR